MFPAMVARKAVWANRASLSTCNWSGASGLEIESVRQRDLIGIGKVDARYDLKAVFLLPVLGARLWYRRPRQCIQKFS